LGVQTRRVRGTTLCTAEFDQQWREVMATATETLDLSEVMATLESWRG
jgi:hypothetical protein